MPGPHKVTGLHFLGFHIIDINPAKALYFNSSKTILLQGTYFSIPTFERSSEINAKKMVLKAILLNAKSLVLDYEISDNIPYVPMVLVKNAWAQFHLKVIECTRCFFRSTFRPWSSVW